MTAQPQPIAPRTGPASAHGTLDVPSALSASPVDWIDIQCDHGGTPSAHKSAALIERMYWEADRQGDEPDDLKPPPAPYWSGGEDRDPLVGTPGHVPATSGPRERSAIEHLDDGTRHPYMVPKIRHGNLRQIEYGHRKTWRDGPQGLTLTMTCQRCKRAVTIAYTTTTETKTWLGDALDTLALAGQRTATLADLAAIAKELANGRSVPDLSEWIRLVALTRAAEAAANTEANGNRKR